jgi:hypothetical protein
MALRFAKLIHGGAAVWMMWVAGIAVVIMVVYSIATVARDIRPPDDKAGADAEKGAEATQETRPQAG